MSDTDLPTDSLPTDGLPTDGLPGHDIPDHDHSNRNWWIALGVAVMFLIGAAGYLIGTRVTENAQELNTADIGFLQDMIDHHDQAVTLGIYGNDQASDASVRHFAMESIIFQRFQVGQMTELLANDGLPRGEGDRTAMEWMGESYPVDAMPGMATQEQLDELAAADPDEANRLFLELMRAHHIGGLHMSDYVIEHGSSPRVRKLAEQMAAQQRAEIVEYEQLQERLGYR